MKKLFFAALVATVAVGGAFAQTYRNTPGASDPGKVKFTCDGAINPTCGDDFAQIYLDSDGSLVTDPNVYLETINYLP